MKIMNANDIIAHLRLEPHPEGGFYRETYRDTQTQNGRSVSTAIYFLLRAGDRSHWHRIDSAEIWHWYAGGPLLLKLYDDQKDSKEEYILSNSLRHNHQPQIIIPPHIWQSAEPLEGWSLVGCTVAPGFEFQKFELAASDWGP